MLRGAAQYNNIGGAELLDHMKIAVFPGYMSRFMDRVDQIMPRILDRAERILTGKFMWPIIPLTPTGMFVIYAADCLVRRMKQKDSLPVI